MKRCLLVLFVALLVCTVQAQYRTYKNQYDVKEYTYQKTDRYSPSAAGILSIIPGLGHCSVGEPLRGFGFFGIDLWFIGTYCLWGFSSLSIQR